VLTPEEVVRLIEAAPSRKYRCAFSVAYGAGLRSSELVSLKVSDIDSTRMVLRIEDGSPQMLDELRAWWKIDKPKIFLFPSRFKAADHISGRQYHRACRDAAIRARIDRSVHPHMLRHSFVTHLLDQGVDIRVIQAMLGHKKLETTAIYARVSPKLIQSVEGPEVVDADLADYFGSIPHAELLKSVARRIVDRRVLHLIKMWLECTVEETDDRGRKTRTTEAKDTRRGIP
jgi:site-specific recombinase XerD